MAGDNAGDTGDSTSTSSTSNGKNDQGTDPKKTQSNDATFDASKLSDEDFKKVLEDPRLWQTERITKLRDRAKKADKYEADQSKAEEARLKEEGKLKELAERLEKERDEALAKANNTLIDMRIAQEATKLGAVDTEAVLALIDRGQISVSDEGEITGIEESVKSLQTNKGYLFGEAGTTSVGSGSNPGSDTNTNARRFKHSQIQDPVFYRENEKEILEAIAQGRVEDDITH